MGASLLVSFEPPRVDAMNGRPDLVRDGGDDVSEYLVERRWSRVTWDEYTHTVIKINLQTKDGVRLTFRIISAFQVTSLSTDNVVQGSFNSAFIFDTMYPPSNLKRYY